MKPVRHLAAPATCSPRGPTPHPLSVGRACIILLLLAVCLAPTALAGAQPATDAPAHVADAWQIRISQIYGGGGLAGAPYQNDFIELHNIGQTAVDVTGWSIQYFKNNQPTAAFRVDLSGVIPAGGYYLAAGRSSNGCDFNSRPCGVPLPVADAATTTLEIVNFNATVYLVNHQNTIQSPCRAYIAPLDMVGYGSGAECAEGGESAPGASSTTAIIREADGCQDTDQNATDFFTGAPIPRNTAAPAVICAPQAVTLATWEARAEGSAVQLTWTTVSEIENAGFNIYRAPATAETWTRINAALIPAQTPGATTGAQYAWTDEAVEVGMAYRYALEDVAFDGTLTRHEPITVTVSLPNAVELSDARANRESDIAGWLVLTGALGLTAAASRLLIRAARQP